MTVSTPTPIISNNDSAATDHALAVLQQALRNSEAATAEAASIAFGNAKRNQVKNACTNCQKACKKCDDSRPCPRCVKYGVSETCVNSVRKERKKGIKRGPYKRRQKSNDDTNDKKTNGTTTSSTLLSLDPFVQLLFTNNTLSAGTTTYSATSSPISANAHTTANATATSAVANATSSYLPANLGQYSQTFDPSFYANAAQVIAQSKDGNNHPLYVLPVYPGFPPALVVSGNNTTDLANASNSESTASIPAVANAGVDTNNSTTSAIYFAPVTNNNGAHQSGAYFQNPQPPTTSHEVKTEEKQPMTPVPSTSNSSGTTSPSADGEDENNRYTRLTQLCTAALRENKQAEENQQVESKPEPSS